MKFEEFKDCYNSLSKRNKTIAYATLLRMHHETIYEGIPAKGYDITENINEKRKELNMTHVDVCKEIEKRSGYVNVEDCYKSMLKRRSEKSELLPIVLDVLGMSEAEAKQSPKDAITIMSRQVASLDWLYDTLLESDKRAIEYLVAALHASEIAPEIFEEDDIYYE